MVSAIFASGGSNVGAKSPLARWIMPPIRRQQRGSLKFQSNNSSVRLHSSSRMAKPSLPPKPCIARCVIDPRGNGWRAAPDLFLGAPLVSPHAWAHLSDRLRVSLGAGGWTCWRQRNVAGKPVSPCSSAATWARRLFSLANTLLVRREQRLSTFPLRWRGGSFVAFDFRNRTGSFTLRAFCL